MKKNNKIDNQLYCDGALKTSIKITKIVFKLRVKCVLIELKYRNSLDNYNSNNE